MTGEVTEDDRAEVARTRSGAAADAAVEPREQVSTVRDVDAAGVPCRFYSPTQPQGVLLYFHGGGFVYGDLDTHDAHCRRIVNRSGWAVLAVHYRRAPEHAFPAAVDDAERAADWLVTDLIGRNLLAVGGDSAGANLALTVALRHPASFVGQALVYPFLDPSCHSYDRSIPDPDFGIDDLAWFWRMYLQGEGAAGDLRADPLLAPSYAGLPAALLQLAELDVLTPTGKLLAGRFAADGVPVEVVTYPGVGHGFWRHDDNDQHDPALDDLASFLDRVGTAST
jgi:acetyl esterase